MDLMDMRVVVAAVAAVVVLMTIAAIVLAIRRRRRRQICATCGARVRRGVAYCSKCGSALDQEEGSAAPQETPGPPATSFELVATKGPFSTQRIPLLSQGLAIGRHADNDIVLSSELMVSRHHAVITPEQGRFVLYDRDSANGTWVNEQRTFRHELAPGDRIQVGHSEFVFNVAGAALPSPVPSVSPLPVVHVEGQQFAGYLLEGLVGRGGMSEVFKARDQNGRVVAIKILQQTDPYLVAKFVQEGNKIGPLLRDHPNIVYVYEFGQSPDNRLYIVMEFVDAPSLRKVLRQPPGGPDVVRVMRQACSALGFAHQHNVVHRDIKPENMLVTADGFVKVLDFGIAKLTSAATVTRDKIIGTPEYISPEQARGEPVQPASDVYSLGIVLYEMLAGSVPFPRPRTEEPYRAAMEVIRQHLEERPKSIRKQNPNAQVSKELERVAMKALEKDIKKRYPSAREMGAALGGDETTLDLPMPQARPTRASLVVLEGPRRGYRFSLGEAALPLGRLDLGSANMAISRRHVCIDCRGGGYWLQDTSKNGTLVDRQRVYGEVPLRAGALIVIGDNVLQFDAA
jgi:pSer/pThr/pTyr-binding forkhead associated (FHA) protein